MSNCKYCKKEFIPHSSNHKMCSIKCGQDAIRYAKQIKEFVEIENLEGEIWKDIEDEPGYIVSNMGRIASNRNNLVGYKLINLHYNRNGYIMVVFKRRPLSRTTVVHRLVAQAFIPNVENKNNVNHKNSIRDDNRVENLEWCTQKENIEHMILAGRGRKNCKYKLLEQSV